MEIEAKNISIGNRLKQARLEKNYTLKEIYYNLKIHISYLEAIERDDFSILPPPSFTKVFIKSYGDFLGLNGIELSHEYEKIFFDKEHKIDEKNIVYHKKPISKKSIISSIIIFILFIILLYFWNSNILKKEHTGKFIDTTKQNFLDSYQEITIDTSKNQDLEEEGHDTLIINQNINIIPETHTAEIIPIDTLWLTVMIDDDSSLLHEHYFRSLRQLDKIDYTFKKSIHIYAGNAAGLIVIVDSSDTLRNFGSKGRTQKIIIDSNFFYGKNE